MTRRGVLGSAVVVAVLAVAVVVGIGAPGVGLDGFGASTSPSPAAPQTPLARHPEVMGVQYTALWEGVEHADREQMTTAVADAGAGWVRLDVGWAALQPDGPGSWDLEHAVPLVDDAVRTAREHDLKILLTFYWAPDWATGGRGKAGHPSPQAYARALQWAADRWGPDVDAWEVWNEPNGKRFWNPTDPVAYAALLEAAYPVIHRTDPGAPVVLGGLESVDLDWLEQLYDAGASGSYDVLAVHPYPSPADLPPGAAPDGTEYRFRQLDELAVVMREHGEQDVPIWLTEVGWSAHENQEDTEPWALGVSEEDQARFLYDSVRIVGERYPQVQGWFWYTIRDTSLGDVHQDGFGLLRADGSRKPAWGALACAAAGRCADAP